MTVSINGMSLQSNTDDGKERVLSFCIWGSSGCGKTTLAATAPGNKLWLSFDDKAVAGLSHRLGKDIFSFDMSQMSDDIAFKLRDDQQPIYRDIKNAISELSINVVVIDSITSYGDKALAYGVKDAKTKLEEPGFKGFGRKNTYTREFVRSMQRVCSQLNVHLIIIAHEDTPKTDDQGAVQFVTIMLGSNLSEQVPLNLSEVWWMYEDNKHKRKIAIRPVRWRKPMKTRIFMTSGQPEFIWDYDADTEKGEGIADWLSRWKQEGYRKIKLPEPSKGDKK